MIDGPPRRRLVPFAQGPRTDPRTAGTDERRWPGHRRTSAFGPPWGPRTGRDEGLRSVTESLGKPSTRGTMRLRTCEAGLAYGGGGATGKRSHQKDDDQRPGARFHRSVALLFASDRSSRI